MTAMRKLFVIALMLMWNVSMSQYATQEALDDTASAHRTLIGLNLTRTYTNQYNISSNDSKIGLNLSSITTNTKNISTLTSLVNGLSSIASNSVNKTDSTGHSVDSYATRSALLDTASAHWYKISENALGISGNLAGIWQIENLYLPAKLDKADSTGHAKEHYATRSALLDTTDACLRKDGSADSVRVSTSSSGGPHFTLENTNGDDLGPIFYFYKKSESIANGDRVGELGFRASIVVADRNVAGLVCSTPQLGLLHTCGQLNFWVDLDDDSTSFLALQGRGDYEGYGRVWVNPSKKWIDFRVSSADSTDAFLVDAANNKVSIGDSLKIGSAGTWLRSIGRTAYGDSLFIVVSATHTGKDTTWLPLK